MQEAKLSLIGQNRMQDLNGGPFGGFRNKIIGGDFGTNRSQRGLSFGPVVSGTYTADRWQYQSNTTGVVTISKDPLGLPVSLTGKLATHCLLIAVNAPDAAVAAGDFSFIGQGIEGYNFQALAQKSIVLSFWHSSNKVGTYCVAFRNAVADRSFVAEFIQAAANTWEYTSIVIPPSPVGGTWNYTNGIGLSATFTLMAGTNFQTTPGVWQTGNFLATANQTNLLGTTGNVLGIALIQIESGTVATPFESRSIQEELALCQRYYAKSYNVEDVPGTITQAGTVGGTVAGATVFVPIKFPVSMRTATTTLVLYSPTTGAVGNWRRLPTAVDVTVAPSVGPSQNSIIIQNTAVAAAGELLFGHYTVDAEL